MPNETKLVRILEELNEVLKQVKSLKPDEIVVKVGEWKGEVKPPEGELWIETATLMDAKNSWDFVNWNPDIELKIPSEPPKTTQATVIPPQKETPQKTAEEVERAVSGYRMDIDEVYSYLKKYYHGQFLSGGGKGRIGKIGRTIYCYRLTPTPRIFTKLKCHLLFDFSFFKYHNGMICGVTLLSEKRIDELMEGWPKRI